MSATPAATETLSVGAFPTQAKQRLPRRPLKAELKLRSINGLIFAAEDFQRVVKFIGLRQEFITFYIPEQNGMIERWFRSLKSEIIWLKQHETVEEAKDAKWGVY